MIRKMVKKFKRIGKHIDHHEKEQQKQDRRILRIFFNMDIHIGELYRINFHVLIMSLPFDSEFHDL